MALVIDVLAKCKYFRCAGHLLIFCKSLLPTFLCSVPHHISQASASVELIQWEAPVKVLFPHSPFQSRARLGLRVCNNLPSVRRWAFWKMDTRGEEVLFRPNMRGFD